MALEAVSVPLYVVARNTVPFQTAALDMIFLGKRMQWQTVLGLMLTFSGTMIYSMADMSVESRGMFFAMLNTVLVSSICVYENYCMTMVKSYLTPIELNFYRILFSMPMMFPMMAYEWSVFEVGHVEVWAKLEPVLFWAILSALFAFSIGRE